MAAAGERLLCCRATAARQRTRDGRRRRAGCGMAGRCLMKACGWNLLLEWGRGSGMHLQQLMQHTSGHLTTCSAANLTFQQRLLLHQTHSISKALQRGARAPCRCLHCRSTPGESSRAAWSPTVVARTCSTHSSSSPG